MSIQDLGSLGELIAAIATLATLGYLAAQVSQAKRQLRDSNLQARTAFTIDLAHRSADQQLRWFSPEGPNEAIMKALLTNERLSPEQQFEFAVQMSIFFGALIQSEQLQRRGLLDDEFAGLRRSIFMPYLRMPRARKWWKRTGRRFYAHDEGVSIVDGMLQEIEAEEAGARSAAE